MKLKTISFLMFGTDSRNFYYTSTISEILQDIRDRCVAYIFLGSHNDCEGDTCYKFNGSWK